MISIRSEEDKCVIVIHEIYGINQHMKNFCEKISMQGFDVICPNLLKRKQPFDYVEEEIAYRHFIENVGFINAAHTIKTNIRTMENKYEKIYIIGFSVGATVAWLCSEEEHVDGIVGYYGSRIRNYLDMQPSVLTLLFFPQEEKSFDVDEFISNLDKPNTEIYQFAGKHGFSDPYSPHFNEASAQAAFNQMLIFLKSY